MGIYESYTKGPKTTDPETGVTSYQEFQHWPGETYVRTVTETGWDLHERTTCFCCSCDDEGWSSDPYCRNHGYAAERPCEVHNMPGQPDEQDVMPSSVQAERARKNGVRA